MADTDSTLTDVASHGGGWASRTGSRLFTLLLLLICIAGGTGLLGGHTATATAVGGGYQLHLSYPGTARPGLDTFWELRVVHDGGFEGHLTIAVTGAYFDLFETQGFYPTPSATTRDGTSVYLTFSPPRQGDTFVVMFDSYLQPYVSPSHLLGNDATVAVVDHGKRLAAIHYRTVVLP